MKLQERILLVDEGDKALGLEEKLAVHQKGLLHRAFSIFVFNSKNELLLQRRALSKYHSPGLWTNSCCSHPTTQKNDLEFIVSRLEFEMGFRCKIEFAFTHRYRAEFDNGLIENELDHVYIGYYEGEPRPNKVEVSEYSWKLPATILEEIEQRPEEFTVWFKEILPRLLEWIKASV